MTSAIMSETTETRPAGSYPIASGIVVGVRVLLGLVLVWAGSSKLLETSSFATDVARYQIMPDGLAIVVASVLPMIEVGLGLCLLSGTCVLPAMLTITGLLLAFLVAQISVLWRGLTISCGCFGSDSPVGAMSVVRTGSLLFSAIFACSVLVFIQRKRRGNLTAKPIGASHE